jgi:hypothetical protein
MSDSKRYTVIAFCLSMIAGALALLFFKDRFVGAYVREVQFAFMGACGLLTVLGAVVIGLSDGTPKKAPLAQRIAQSLPIWKAIGKSIALYAWARFEDALVHAAAKAGQAYHASQHPRLR